MGDTGAVTGVEAERDDLLGDVLRPGMTAVALGPDAQILATRMAAFVGPAGLAIAVDPAPGERLEDLLPDPVDLVVLDFWPQALREAEVDPVAALDRYRAAGLSAIGLGMDLPADPGALVQTIDAAQPPRALLQLARVESPSPVRERLLPRERRLGRRWQQRFPPVEPETLAYDAAHRAIVRSLLESEDWLQLFGRDGRLPPGLGAGFDERIVEYPWLFSRGLSGHVLDAGSVLNHRHLIEALRPRVEDLTIVTLAPEPVAFTELGVSYVYGDMRLLPFRDDWFDEVVCLSTLEHVGMDTAVYGAAAPRAESPREEAATALRELLRVVRPGGRVHVSVPFGTREDHGWLRQLDREDVDDLLAQAGVGRHEETAFRQTARGWRSTAPARLAKLGYNAAPGRAADGAVAARGVLCLTIFA